MDAPARLGSTSTSNRTVPYQEVVHLSAERLPNIRRRIFYYKILRIRGELYVVYDPVKYNIYCVFAGRLGIFCVRDYLVWAFIRISDT